MAKKRQAVISRKTNEVDIKGKFLIGGKGKAKIDTGFDSLNHMLQLFAFHGFFDLELKAEGDLEHHIMEDIGIVLGDAFKKAIGDGYGIKRFGYVSIPMDEILAKVSVDISGRTFMYMPTYNIKENMDIDSQGFRDFLKAFIEHAKLTIHFEIFTPHTETDSHHYFEAVFKALGKALDCATQIEPRRKTIPSTKGIID
jgi:imidazoleglycerol-phosphate dehydratase